MNFYDNDSEKDRVNKRITKQNQVYSILLNTISEVKNFSQLSNACKFFLCNFRKLNSWDLGDVLSSLYKLCSEYDCDDLRLLIAETKTLITKILEEYEIEYETKTWNSDEVPDQNFYDLEVEHYTIDGLDPDEISNKKYQLKLSLKLTVLRKYAQRFIRSMKEIEEGADADNLKSVILKLNLMDLEDSYLINFEVLLREYKSVLDHPKLFLRDFNEEKLTFNNHNLLSLEREIINHFKKTKRCTSHYKEAYDWLISLLKMNQSIYDEIDDIAPFGSAVQMTDNMSSDLDITIISKNEILYNSVIDYLQKIEEKNDSQEFKLGQLYFAKHIPLVSIEYKSIIKLELSFNNPLGTFNSALLRNYALIDSRVPMLIGLVKDWSKYYMINGNRDHFLSSFCYSMLVIYFLAQVKVVPFFKCNKSKFLTIHDQGKQALIPDPDQLFFVDLPSASENEQSIAELFVNFLIFYGYFFNGKLFEVNITSDTKLAVRNESSTKKSGQYKNFYKIVDPFNLKYNPASYFNCNHSQEEKFFKVIDHTLHQIKRNKRIFDI